MLKKIITLIFIVSSLWGALDNPYKIAVDSAGNYFVADTLHNSVKKFATDGTHLELPYNFNQPQAVAVDRANNIYVIDTGSNRILKFKDNGSNIDFIKDLSINLNYPRDIEISPDGKFIFILDAGNNSVLRLKVENGVEKPDIRFGELSSAYGLGIDTRGNIYVADTGKHEILKYNYDGRLLRRFGREGSNKGEFFFPKDVVVGHSGHIIVADSGNQRIQKLNEEGHYLNEIKLPFEIPDIRGLALNNTNGKLYVSGSGLENIISIDIGFKIKSFTIENDVFSPNNDHFKDYPIFKCELLEPTDLSLDILKDGVIVEHFDGPKGTTEFQKINWISQKKLEPGIYDYIFYCSDPKGQREPATEQGTISVDLDPPQFEELIVSPNTISPDGDGLNDQLNFKAQFNENALLQCDLYKNNKEKTFFASITGTNPGLKQSLSWNGENKYKEINNGIYHYSVMGIDLAGNRSIIKEGEVLVAYEHPLITKALLSAKQIRKTTKINLSYTVANTAKIKILIKKLDNSFSKNLFSGELPAGEYQKELSFKDLTSGEYTLLIEATRSNITDIFHNRLLIDDEAPKLTEVAISKKKFWSNGFDKTTVSFKSNEKGLCTATLKNAQGKTIATIRENDPVPANAHYEFNFSGIDSKDKILPAGKYTLYLEVTDELGNTTISSFEIKIVSSAPQIKNLTLSSDVLAPLGYGMFRYIEFKYEIEQSLGDIFISLRILKNGELIESITDRQKRFPGPNYDYWQANEKLTDGIYQYELVIHNEYGLSSKYSGDLYVINQKPLLKGFTYSEDVFSPANRDGHKDTETFSFSSIISNSLILKSISTESTITSRNILPRKVKLIVNIGNNRFEVFEESGPHQYIWKGKDLNGNYMIDNSYDYEIYAIDAVGQESARITGSIAISNSPDKITYFRLDINGTPSPNGTFNPYTGNSTVTLNYGMSNFPTWQKMTAYIYNDTGRLLRNLPTKTFSGSGNYTAAWDGRTDTGSYVNDGRYCFELNIIDGIGNNFTFTTMGSRVPSLNYRDEIFVVAENEKTYLYSLVANGSGEPRVYYQRGIKEPRIPHTQTAEAVCPGSSAQEINISTPLSTLPYAQSILVNITSGGDFDPEKTFLSIDGGPTNNVSFTRYFTTLDPGIFTLQAASNGSGTATINYVLTYYSYDYNKYFIDSIRFKNWQNKTGPIPQLSPWSYPQPTTLNYYGFSHQIWTDGNSLYYKRGNGSLYTTNIILASGDILDPVLATYNNELYVLWGDSRPGVGDIRTQKIPQYFLPVEETGFTMASLTNNSKKYRPAGYFISAANIPTLIYPIHNELVSEPRISFSWEAPTWAVSTSTNYNLNISAENQIFGELDDIDIALAPAQISFSGTSSNIASYKLPQTQELSPGNYAWRIIARDSLSLPPRSTSNIENFYLQPTLEISKQINYPNPFSEHTTIRYQLSQDADITIRIFNLAGQLVKTLEFDSGTEGGKATSYFDPYNDIIWDGTNDFGDEAVNDPYIYEITARQNSKQEKVKGRMVKWK